MAASARPSFHNIEPPHIEPPSEGYLICKTTAAGLTVFSDLDAIHRLESEAIEALASLPKRGMEIGGLLLGRTQDDGRLIIEDYESIPSEHRRGPSYLLSEKDKQLFGERILHWATAGERRVIGLYRTNTRTGFGPGEEDVALLAEHCQDGQGVLLLLQPALGRPSKAKLFLDGRSDQGFEFPLHPSVLSSGQSRIAETPGPVRAPAPTAPTPATEPEPQPLPQPVETAQAAEESAVADLTEPAIESKPSRKSIRPSWLAAVVAVPIVATALFGLQMWRSSSRGLEARPAPIGLLVAWSDGSLHLRWDRNSNPVLQAKKGIVWIVDGQRRQLIILDPRQLRQGSIQYWPQSRNVEFQLQLVTDAYRTSESVTATNIPEPVSSESQTPDSPARASVPAQPHGAPISNPPSQ